MKKGISILLTIVGIIMIAIGAIPKIATLVTSVTSAYQSVSVIGGADGPTAIFIAGKIGGPELGWISIIAGAALLLAGIIMLIKGKNRL